MNINEFNQRRNELNRLMQENDAFFQQFGDLDDEVYSDGAIPKKYKELIGLAISVLSRCEDCVLYHIQNCITEGATKIELVEATKLGVIGGGSITYPTARFAFNMMKDMNIL